MRKLFFILLLLFPLLSYSQQKYPIKTVYHEDSVVILTTQQSNQINNLIDEQSKRISELEENLSKVEKENGRLSNKVEKMSTTISDNDSTITFLKDTLQKSNTYYTDEVDSLNKEMERIKNWFIDAAINNTFIYLDWDKYSIKVVNLNGYKSKRTIFGKVKFIPLNISNLKEYTKYKIKNKIEPTGDLDKLYQMESPIKIEYITWQE